jgi:hypothetical protein
MVRLDGLVKGGAAGNHEGCFMEHMRTLKDPLLDQMVDRCALVTAGANTLTSHGYMVGVVAGLDGAAACSLLRWHALPDSPPLLVLLCCCCGWRCCVMCRRSAVARQAAHLFSVLAAALGIKMEQYAVTFMSALYKGLVITVQVRQEASRGTCSCTLRCGSCIN